LNSVLQFLSIFISISISISYILFNFKLCSADQIFNENCKTSEVYEARTKDIVAAAVRGFNGLEYIFLSFVLFVFSLLFWFMSC
jgi:hypothetical protein